MSSVKDLTVGNLTPDLVKQVLTTIGMPAPPQAIETVLNLAKEAPQDEQVLSWATKLVDDGTLAKVIAPKSMLVRCPHCTCPHEVKLNG